MTHETLSGRIVVWLFVLAPLCVGVYFAGKGLVEHPLPWDSVGWNQTHGTITGRSVVLRGAHTMWRESSGKRSWFDADVSYQYEMDGGVFPGEESFVLDDRTRERLSRKEAEVRAAERFPIGATVAVSYDPNDVSRSTLRTGWTGGGMADIATGLSCFALAGYVAWNMRRKETA